jgi:hypothetical protein
MTTYIPFTWSTYEDKNVLLRDYDRWANVTKICEATGKKYDDLIDSPYWKSKVSNLQTSIMRKTPSLYYKPYTPYPHWTIPFGARKKDTPAPSVFYEYTEGPVEYHGVYIHPELINTAFDFCFGKRYYYFHGVCIRSRGAIPWKDEYELKAWLLNEQLKVLNKHKQCLISPTFKNRAVNVAATLKDIEDEIDKTEKELSNYLRYLFSRQSSYSNRVTKIY